LQTILTSIKARQGWPQEGHPAVKHFNQTTSIVQFGNRLTRASTDDIDVKLSIKVIIVNANDNKSRQSPINRTTSTDKNV